MYPQVVGSQGKGHFAIPVKKPHQFQHRLTGQNDLLVLLSRRVQLQFRQGQAVSVRGDRAQRISVGFEQQPVQVVADILMSHGEVRFLQQFAETVLIHPHILLCGDLFHHREVFGSETGQGEPAAGSLQCDSVAGDT